jgi:hypothetical protein
MTAPLTATFSEMMEMSSVLYTLLCDVGPLAREESVRTGIYTDGSKTGPEAKRAFYTARATRSAALTPQLAALKQHIEAAHQVANNLVEEFCLQKMAIRRKLATVHTAMKTARKEGWMPKACFPPLIGTVKPAELEEALNTYSHGMPAEAKEELRHAVTAVYSAMGALTWLAGAEEEPPLEETRDLFRAAFGAVLMCKGILGKADKGMEKVWLAVKLCLDHQDLMDSLTLDDLGQMIDLLGAMEEALEAMKPAMAAGDA